MDNVRASIRVRGKSGFSLLEVVIALAVLAIALFGLLSAFLHMSRFNAKNRELQAADRGAERMIETLRNTPFPEVFRRYNPDPSDDPGGPGTAPGPDFDVEGLLPQPGDPDGKCGKVLFPVNGTKNQLREDTHDDDLLMPRDLNGNKAIDTTNVDATAQIIPVTIQIDWQAIHGPASRVYRTVILKKP